MGPDGGGRACCWRQHVAVQLTCWGGQKAPFILLLTSASLSSMKMALLGSLLDIFSCPCTAGRLLWRELCMTSSCPGMHNQVTWQNAVTGAHVPCNTVQAAG